MNKKIGIVGCGKDNKDNQNSGQTPGGQTPGGQTPVKSELINGGCESADLSGWTVE